MTKRVFFSDMVVSPQGPGSSLAAAAGETAVEEMAERLAQTEQLVAQLKELIREKDTALCSKDEQLKVSRPPLRGKSVERTRQHKCAAGFPFAHHQTRSHDIILK